jgi:hypothetical protein
MKYIQLSLPIENCTDTPLETVNKPQKTIPSQPIMINSCTTERTASILNISPSTLYRARKQGKSYQINQWTAQAINRNAWRVIYQPSA